VVAMPSSAARSRRYRQRQHAGKRVAHFEVDEVIIEPLLIHHGLLPRGGTDDPAVFDAALAEFIISMAAADAAQHNG
jgi:hypothetical protein